MFANNPLYGRLTHSARWPSLRAARAIAAGLGLTALALGLYELNAVVNGSSQASLSGPLGFGAWLLGLLLCPVASATASSLTRQATSGDEYRLLRLTPITSGQIVNGLVTGALFRLRLALAIFTGLFPVMVLGIVSLTLDTLIRQVFAVGVSGQTALPYQVNTLDVLGLLAQVAAVALGIAAAIVLSAGLGVTIGLKGTNIAANILAAASSFLLSGVGLLAILTLLGPSIGGTGFSHVPNPVAEIVVPTVFCLVLPIGLIPAILWIARRRAG